MVSRTATESRKVKCLVVEVPADQAGLLFEEIANERLPEAIEARLRPSARDLLPWADPYIAGLIRNLQDEVRAEREAEQLAARHREQESSGSMSLRDLLVDVMNHDAPLAESSMVQGPFESEDFESDSETESEWSHRPMQPR